MQYEEVCGRDDPAPWMLPAPAGESTLLVYGGRAKAPGEAHDGSAATPKAATNSTPKPTTKTSEAQDEAAATPKATRQATRTATPKATSQASAGKPKVGDPLDAAGLLPNPLTGEPLRDPDAYRRNAQIWSALPVYREAAAIEATIREHPATVVSSGTGSGKSVVVPRLAMQAVRALGGVRAVAVTTPKQVTTLSLARTTAAWADVRLGEEVGYRFRGDSAVSDRTVMEFTTDGSLLARARRDPDLSEFGCIVVDEAHERSLPTDLLLLAVKRAMARRPDLRLVVMSATLDARLFRDYFGGDAVGLVDLPAKPNKPVKMHWAKVESKGHVTDAVARFVAIAAAGAPRGDVLAFVPTVRDTTRVCEELSKTAKDLDKTPRASADETSCMPLHSRVTADGKNAAILASPAGTTKLVAATNIAESSITLQGLGYVVDSGKSVQVSYDPKHHATRVRSDWISQAEAKQRYGRVGREAPGEVFCLYPQKRFDAMSAMPPPSLSVTDLTDDLFRLAIALGGDVSAALADLDALLTPPTPQQVHRTTMLLSFFGLVSGPPGAVKLTPGGWALADLFRQLSIDTFGAAVLALSARMHHCLDAAADLVALADTAADLDVLVRDTAGLASHPRHAALVCRRSEHVTAIRLLAAADEPDVAVLLNKKVARETRRTAASIRRQAAKLDAEAAADPEGRHARRMRDLQRLATRFPWCMGAPQRKTADLSDPETRACGAVLAARMHTAVVCTRRGQGRDVFLANTNVDIAGIAKATAPKDVVVSDGFLLKGRGPEARMSTAFTVAEKPPNAEAIRKALAGRVCKAMRHSCDKRG